jgi:acyl carrier protein
MTSDRALVLATVKAVVESAVAERAKDDPDADGIAVTGDLRLRGFDSFSVVEMVLDIEDALQVSILSDLVAFKGDTLDEFVDFVVAARRVAHT